MLVSITACGNKDNVIAKIDDVEIKMSDIEKDIKFISQMDQYNLDEEGQYDQMVMDVLNTYMIDYMCKEELERLGMKYSDEYYGAAYETLIEAYGSEKKLVDFIKTLGLDREYLEELCRKEARKATLCEYLIKNVEIPESEILAYYIENSETFTVDLVRSFYFLTFKNKADADAALEDIRTNGFLPYFEAQSTLATADYFDKLEHFEKDAFPTSAANILFGMSVGTFYDEAISTFANSGYSIFYCYEEIADYKFSYDEMKVAIEEALREDEEDAILENFFDEINKDYTVEIYYNGK